MPFGALTYRPEFPKCFRTLVVKIEKTNSNSTGDFSKRINFNRVDPFIGSTLVVKIKKNRNPLRAFKNKATEDKDNIILLRASQCEFWLFFFLQETGAHRVSRYGRREGRALPARGLSQGRAWTVRCVSAKSSATMQRSLQRRAVPGRVGSDEDLMSWIEAPSTPLPTDRFTRRPSLEPENGSRSRVCVCLAPPPPLTLLLRGAATQGSSSSRCGRPPAQQPRHPRRRKGPSRAVEGCHSCSAQREGEPGHRLVWLMAASLSLVPTCPCCY